MGQIILNIYCDWNINCDCFVLCDCAGNNFIYTRFQKVTKYVAGGINPSATYYMGALALSKDKKRLSMRDIGQFAVLTVSIFLSMKVFFVLAFVPTGSMEPTIKEKSAVIGWRLSYLLSDPLPDRGEIIIFDHEEFNNHLIKRVVGLPGDEVLISDGQVYVNSEKLDEPYLAELDSGEHNGQFTVPEGKLFVLGDNRNHSNDSRFWVNPFVDVEKVYAKALIWLQLPHL